MWYNTVISPYSYSDNNSKSNVLNSFLDACGNSRDYFSSYSSKEEGEHLSLSIDLPGAKSTDVKVESLIGQVKIFGKQKGKEFLQTYSLPKVYDPSSGVAKLEDGVLNIVFSKFKTAKPSVYSIEVK